MDDLIFFYPQGHEAHAEPGHPERPERVEAIRKALGDAGLWEKYPKAAPLELPEGVLHAIHTPAYLEKLESASREGRRFDLDTYLTPASWQLALNAAGGAAAVAQAVWARQAKRGFALTRPPGHHATADRAMGFCLLNNVALAAEYLLQVAGAGRLAIVDIDLHHGNGTQDIFYRRGEVFYLSTHQYPHYPGTGQLTETGAGPGEGTTANVPLPPFSGDEAFQAVFERLFLPLLDRFQPEMLLVSVGFDAHWRDPLGYLQLSVDGYGKIAQALTQWADEQCQGRLAFFLEGGYDLDAGAQSALAVAQAMLGQTWEDLLGKSTHDEGVEWERILRECLVLWGV